MSNSTPTHKEAVREAQLKRWRMRAPYRLVMVEKSGLEFATNGEVTYLLLRGQKLPLGTHSTGVFDHWEIRDRNGVVVIRELTLDRAERIRDELDLPFATEATP